ncbi:site-specific integrase, partial [Candidatus Bathyarchaeota archaeon]|nr:site-specific integrase [Candidatus Bathyarchaeota archaeon]
IEWSNKGVEYTQSKLEQGLFGKKALRVDLEPRKDLAERFNYHTYVYAKDTVNALENWLDFRQKKRYSGQALFVNKNGAPLTHNALGKSFLNRSRKLGIYTPKGTSDVGNRYGWSPHIIRSFFKTWMWKCPAPNWIADAMMGHSVDSNDYMRLFNDDAWMLEHLIQAEPWFNIISSTVPFDLESKTTMSLLQQEQNSRVAELESELERMKKQQEEFMKLLYKKLPRQKTVN